MSKFDLMNGDEIPLEPKAPTRDEKIEGFANVLGADRVIPNMTPAGLAFMQRYIVDHPEVISDTQRFNNVSMGYRAATRDDIVYTVSNVPGDSSIIVNENPTVQGHLAMIDHNESLEPNQTDFTIHVDVATTHNIELLGLFMIDGVILYEGYRVLVKNQINADENGIYQAGRHRWERLPGFSTPIGSLRTVLTVEDGDTYIRTRWLIGARSTDMSSFSSIIFIQEVV